MAPPRELSRELSREPPRVLSGELPRELPPGAAPRALVQGGQRLDPSA